MKRLPLILTIIALAAVAGSYFLYQQLSPRQADPWNLIPPNALAVLEVDDTCPTCTAGITQSALWQIMERATLTGKDDSLRKQIHAVLQESKAVKISLHQTKRDGFDVIFFISHTPPRFANIGEKKIKLSERSFGSNMIKEVSVGSTVFSYCLIDGVWVGSFTAFLIEDVIRTYENGTSTVRGELQSVKVLPAITGDAGNLYVQLNHIGNFISIFYPSGKLPVTVVGKSSVLDVKYEDGRITLNGFSLDTVNNSRYLLSIFKNQDPTPFEMKMFVSNKALAATSFGVSNGAQFYADLKQFRAAHKINDSLRYFLGKSKVDGNRLFNSINDEIAVQFIQSSRKGAISSVLMLETKDPQYWLNALRQIAEDNSEDSLAIESYGDHLIRELPVFRLVEKFFTPLVSGFDRSYYTSIGNRIVIADNVNDLKSVLNDIASDDTWGKSLRYNKFFESTLLESSVSTYFNISKAMAHITAGMHPKWKAFFTYEKKQWQSGGMGCFQFSHLNNSYYTNAIIEGAAVNETERREKENRIVVNLETPIRSIHIVKSHVNLTDEVLLQDSVNNLLLISADGSLLWKVPVGDAIAGDVTQIDFYRNGKLQYFFATSSALHVIDRLGNYVDGYPAKIPSGNLQYATVVDYDNSKNYRFLATDSTGSIWMFDKNGNNLEGWRPRFMSEKVITAPQHFRVKGKDYIVAPLEHGLLAVMTRRGEMMKGFPIKFSGRIAGDFAFEGGNDLKDSYIIVATDDGYKQQINLNGKLISKDPILKTSVNSKFRIVSDRSFRSYLLLQQDPKHFKLYNDDGKEVITSESIGDNKVDVSIYHAGSDQNFVSITDISQQLSYLYTFNSDALTDPPIESSQLVVRPADDRSLTLFYTFGKSVVIENLDY